MLHLTEYDKLMLVEVAIPPTTYVGAEHLRINWFSRGTTLWVDDLEFKPECIIVTPHPEKVRTIAQEMVSQHCENRKQVRWWGKWIAKPIMNHLRCVRVREIGRDELPNFKVPVLKKPFEPVVT